MSDCVVDGVLDKPKGVPETKTETAQKKTVDEIFAALTDVLGITTVDETLLKKASVLLAERLANIPKQVGANSNLDDERIPDAWQFRIENGQWVASTAPTNSPFDVKYRDRFRPLYTKLNAAGIPDIARIARPISEYDESMGDVLWWKFPIVEAPYVGSPLDLGITVEAHTTTRLITQIDQEHQPEPTVARIDVGGWPGYHTHFTQIIIPETPMPVVTEETEE